MRGTESFYHVGLLVPRLEPALDELGDLLGVDWRPTIDSEVPVRVPGGTEEMLRLRFAYSAPTPCLEVIEAVPDTPWALSETGSNLHHLGFWAGDVAGESDRMARSRCPLEAAMVGPGGESPATFAYHRTGGIRIELIDRAVEALMFPDLAGRASDGSRPG